MRDRRLVDSHAPRDLRVRFTGVGPRAHELRQVERRQPVALLVLGHLRVDVMGRSADDDGHLSETGLPGRAYTLCAEEDPVAAAAAGAVHDDWLKDAVHADVGRELRQLAFRELGSRVPWVLVQQLDGYKQRFACRNGLGVEEVGLVRSGGGTSVKLGWCPRVCAWLVSLMAIGDSS